MAVKAVSAVTEAVAMVATTAVPAAMVAKLMAATAVLAAEVAMIMAAKAVPTAALIAVFFSWHEGEWRRGGTTAPQVVSGWMALR
ncbi:hypothetical protein FOZ63_002191 [Perkinsus olseni]|uniref:Uncharacterized protein n=1 Tax=Perkinsus olseni TaxID=32597 RepID=A0A7J6RLZ0_PEROL|nr:hypothetical protein FOZ63_002191 [Perkinsus olseni]